MHMLVLGDVSAKMVSSAKMSACFSRCRHFCRLPSPHRNTSKSMIILVLFTISLESTNLLNFSSRNSRTSASVVAIGCMPGRVVFCVDVISLIVLQPDLAPSHSFRLGHLKSDILLDRNHPEFHELDHSC